MHFTYGTITHYGAAFQQSFAIHVYTFPTKTGSQRYSLTTPILQRPDLYVPYSNKQKLIITRYNTI